MQLARRWHRLIFVAAGIATLAVVLLSAYLFTGLWLRARVAKELVAAAQELQVDPPSAELASDILWLNLAFIDPPEPNVAEITERLESLQTLSPRAVFRELFHRRAAPREQFVVANRSVAFYQSTIRAAGSGTVVFSSENSILSVDNTSAEPTIDAPADAVDRISAEPVAVALPGEEVAQEQPKEPPASGDAASLENSGILISGRATLQFGTNRVAVTTRLWGVDTHKCATVTDASGEKLYLVTRPHAISAEADKSQTAAAESSPTSSYWLATTDGHVISTDPSVELLVVDSGGKIINRFAPPGWLLGRLSEPLGRADQLVFDRRDFPGVNPLVSCPAGVVAIIEHGRLKVVRELSSVQPADAKQTAPTTPAPPEE